ncbi:MULTISPECIES: glycosyltransferase [Pasteurellaceae]|uniref:Glycosyltransferase n=1 Tax=Pasteurella atlantica TaxID=2827233 RepID=A0AAW8CRT3_9PAST|nr:glycosyltransferase [Pasteurella atlantica]MBR0574433.1 glycosyltransferase [Pasteurella atlantica]MDP8040328.1 glycosyltransferase [Pasteurella atlantica]MDP8042488.1 glycosyltransferase [Pasteurella atlantica]MDP8044598.1 glycosyltransferase [Pasteurella atlantica]MDP8046655.1 glycosyltransferase [Pasteurella atlantica]
MKFSVLISIYYKENSKYFNQAMESVWDNQSLKPSEIVLVEDGELTDELYQAIDGWKEKLQNILKIIPLENNIGLGKALNEGIKYCSYEFIARMDSDDICTPNRFEKQIKFLQENPKTDILGGQLDEFEKEIGNIKSSRKLPLIHNEIVKFAKKRSPFNHPLVIYRKSAVEKVGGYQDDHLYEDYALWVRMIHNGAIVANLPDTILYMRAGNDMFKRRGGFKYAISEIKSQYKFYKIGFLSFFEFLKNCIIRTPVRIMPNELRVFIYEKILRVSN